MACECRDSEGKLLDLCIGTCNQRSFINEQHQRAETMERKFAEMFDKILGAIKQLAGNVECIKNQMYREGFKDGFQTAKDHQWD